MKMPLPLIPALVVAFVSTTALADDAADMQAEQQACQDDVYTYCGEEIPDHDRIAACLKKHWGKISKECRTVMINHGRKRNRH